MRLPRGLAPNQQKELVINQVGFEYFYKDESLIKMIFYQLPDKKGRDDANG